MPVSLVSDRVVTTSGATFVVSAMNGNIMPGTMDGFYASDTRFLSEFRVQVDGRTPAMLGSGNLDHNLASFYGSTDPFRTGNRRGLTVVRDRHVEQDLHDDIYVLNHQPSTRTVVITVHLDADFADIFQVRRQTFVKAGVTRMDQVSDREVRVTYVRGAFERSTLVQFSQPPRIGERHADFEVTLPEYSSWHLCVAVSPVIGESALSTSPCIRGSIGDPFSSSRPQRVVAQAVQARRVDGAFAAAPAIYTARPGIRQAYERALEDLTSLLITDEDWSIYAAGLPWFMAVFGRDSIIASLQTKAVTPALMEGTLKTLARYQSEGYDDFREAQPGKIPHEIRKGELSVFEEVPHSRYYGSVDSTPLFVVLAAEMLNWTGDEESIRELLPAVEAALRWIDTDGDQDGDGFVEYPSDSTDGLRNQNWKDSEDSMSFADGRLAEGAIAAAEVQGYVYAAKRGAAGIYRHLGRYAEARDLEEQAAALQRRFDDAFWMPGAGYYATALDGYKQQVNSITSNIGHCLWAGIVPSRRAGVVAERLTAPDMFSGWGVRTLSSEMARYDPVSYHNGSVWPHDNSMIAAGLARYGLHQQGREVIAGLFDAAASFPDSRLPELFAGYPRRAVGFPVPYPLANSPQAWAAGAIIYCIETLLGLEADGDQLRSTIPAMSTAVSLRGVTYRGSSWDF